jgi:Fur family peroxide stress response transcriptional regulator
MNYENLLHEHTLKATPQRLGILSLMHANGHISIDELFEQIKKQFSSISLATLYKNINAMLESSLITEVKIPNMKPKYEIAKDTHAHLLCDACGEFKDISIDLEKLISLTEAKSNYALKDTSLIFSGLCEKCQ